MRHCLPVFLMMCAGGFAQEWADPVAARDNSR